MSLSEGTVLNDRYTIRGVFEAAGAFAATYTARDEQEDQDVLVVEYCPRHLSEQSGENIVARNGEEASYQRGLEFFREEAKALRGIDHAGLAREIEDFEARGTAYRVSKHRRGASLARALENNDGSISEEAALAVIQPVLAALHALHLDGLVHGGIGPSAIYLTQTRKVLLRGFRGAHLQLARETGRLDETTTPGISPAEQYDPDGRHGPWMDVYATAATLYRAVSGETLPEAKDGPVPEQTIMERLEAADGFSEGMRLVLMRALAPRPRARLQSARALRELLEDPSKAFMDGEELEAAAGASGEPVEDMLGADPFGAGQTEEGGQEEGDTWGMASLAAAAAEAAKEDKEKMREQRRAGEAPGKQLGAREDREPDERAEEDDEDGLLPVSNGVAMGGGAALLVLVLVGAGLLFMGGESNAEGSSADRYARLVAQGDSLFEAADYEAASQRYEQAQDTRPEGASQRVTERLLMIDRLNEAVGDETYRRAIARGDSLSSRAERTATSDDPVRAQVLYEQANEAYVSALGNRPDDSLALARVQATRSLLEGDSQTEANMREEQSSEQTLEQERQRLFERYRDQGDEAFTAGNYEEARRRFRRALEYRPDDNYVQGELEEIEGRLSTADRQEQYTRYRQRADSLLAAGELEAARSEYALAVEAQPGGAAAAERGLQTVEDRLAERRRQQEQYQLNRSRGDVQFGEGNYQESADSYRAALAIRPDDDYARRRLEEAKTRLAEVRREAEVAEAEEARRAANRTEDGFYTVTDEAAKVVGGRRALLQEVRYPSQAQRRGVEGRVFLRVAVSAAGSVERASVVRGPGAGLNEEALRVVRQAAFEPAILDGEAVPAMRTLMIQFQLDN